MLNELQDGTWQFVIVNWQTIIITIIGGLLFFILSYYGLRRYVTSAERERLIQAKNSILDILESRIISKQSISKIEIDRLLKAIDREYSVDLLAIVSPSSLLEDLQLRFEKSRHLDSSQKEEYRKKLEEIANEMNKEGKTVTISVGYSKIIDDLTENIKLDKSKEALATLDLLKKKMREKEEFLMYRPSELFLKAFIRTSRRNPWIMLAALIFYIILFYVMLSVTGRI